jgi:hypothetical protein
MLPQCSPERRRRADPTRPLGPAVIAPRRARQRAACESESPARRRPRLLSLAGSSRRLGPPPAPLSAPSLFFFLLCVVLSALCVTVLSGGLLSAATVT